jgi:SAM-dependent methyltransferase
VGSGHVAHAFTAVDRQPRPGELLGVLDRLAAEPFYGSYKHRLRGLLQSERGSRVLDVGAGTGANALALAAESGTEVVAVDQSMTMAAAIRARTRAHVVVADGHRLPFRASGFDGVLADRVLQHVAEPERVLDQMLRILRPGGRIALADPDYSTQVLDIEDRELAGRVLGYRAQAALRNGTLAHRLAGLLAARGLREITVEARTLVVRDPRAVDNVLGLRSWAHAAAAHGYLESADAERFVEQFDAAVDTGRFMYAVTFFLTAATLGR